MRLGLAGAGPWGRRYIATIRELPHLTLAHVASANPASAALVPSGCALSADWRALAGDRSLDGLIIATPPATHLEIALLAIAHGIPVLVEKPMTLSLADANLLAERARRARVLVMVGHTHLYSAAFSELKTRGAALGTLRDTRSAGGNRGPYRPDTPVLWDWGSHDVAMCLELFGVVPDAVQARRVAAAPLPEGPGEAIEIVLQFGTDRCSRIRIGNIEERKRRRFEARYDGGTLVYDDLAANKLVFRTAGSSVEEPLPIDASLPLTNLVGEFCHRIEIGDPGDAGLELGRRVVEVLATCESKLEAVGAGAAAPATAR